MTFRDLIAPVSNLNDLTIIQDAVEKLLNERREQILRQKMSAGQQVGMVAETGRGRKKVRTPVNGMIIGIKGGKAVIRITAPMKFVSDSTKYRSPFQLICDPFDLSQKKESILASIERPDFEELGSEDEGDDPDPTGD